MSSQPDLAVRLQESRADGQVWRSALATGTQRGKTSAHRPGRAPCLQGASTDQEAQAPGAVATRAGGLRGLSPQTGIIALGAVSKGSQEPPGTGKKESVSEGPPEEDSQ